MVIGELWELFVQDGPIFWCSSPVLCLKSILIGAYQISLLSKLRICFLVAWWLFNRNLSIQEWSFVLIDSFLLLALLVHLCHLKEEVWIWRLIKLPHWLQGEELFQVLLCLCPWCQLWGLWSCWYKGWPCLLGGLKCPLWASSDSKRDVIGNRLFWRYHGLGCSKGMMGPNRFCRWLHLWGCRWILQLIPILLGNTFLQRKVWATLRQIPMMGAGCMFGLLLKHGGGISCRPLWCLVLWQRFFCWGNVCKLPLPS